MVRLELKTIKDRDFPMEKCSSYQNRQCVGNNYSNLSQAMLNKYTNLYILDRQNEALIKICIQGLPSVLLCRILSKLPYYQYQELSS